MVFLGWEGSSRFGGKSRRFRTLGGAANGAGESAEGDSLGLALDVLKEGNSALELPAVDSLGGLAGVLERHTEVGTAGAGRLRGLNLLGGVPSLLWREKHRCQSGSSVVDNFLIVHLAKFAPRRQSKKNTTMAAYLVSQNWQKAVGDIFEGERAVQGDSE